MEGRLPGKENPAAHPGPGVEWQNHVVLLAGGYLHGKVLAFIVQFACTGHRIELVFPRGKGQLKAAVRSGAGFTGETFNHEVTRGIGNTSPGPHQRSLQGRRGGPVEHPSAEPAGAGLAGINEHGLRKRDRMKLFMKSPVRLQDFIERKLLIHGNCISRSGTLDFEGAAGTGYRLNHYIKPLSPAASAGIYGAADGSRADEI